MADAPRFALYVSSVAGRLVSRPGAPHSYIGARIPTPDERKAGASEPTWQTDVVVPVLEGEYSRYVREWDALVNGGDLVKRTPEDFAAYTKAVEAAEKSREAELAAVAAAAAAAQAPAVAPSTDGPPPVTPEGSANQPRKGSK